MIRAAISITVAILLAGSCLAGSVLDEDFDALLESKGSLQGAFAFDPAGDRQGAAAAVEDPTAPYYNRDLRGSAWTVYANGYGNQNSSLDELFLQLPYASGGNAYTTTQPLNVQNGGLKFYDSDFRDPLPGGYNATMFPTNDMSGAHPHPYSNSDPEAYADLSAGQGSDRALGVYHNQDGDQAWIRWDGSNTADPAEGQTRAWIVRFDAAPMNHHELVNDRSIGIGVYARNTTDSANVETASGGGAMTFWNVGTGQDDDYSRDDASVVNANGFLINPADFKRTSSALLEFGSDITLGDSLQLEFNIHKDIGTTAKDGTSAAYIQKHGGAMIDNVLFLPAMGGDANADLQVSIGDLGILAGNYGTEGGASWAMGDFNGDGDVSIGDLGILAGNYGSSYGMPEVSVTVVPEPATLGLLAVGGFMALSKRKRKA
ncbi:MAG: PEP-CTERM sorting domain-containing protein [Phycisphaerae bacterium]